MSEDKRWSRDSGSDFFSDDALRRCLLGCAHPGEQARFEERLLVDDEMEKRVRMAEFELVDDFGFGRLNAAEQELFTINFLVTEERGQRLAVSRALRRALTRRSAETSALSESRLEVGKGGLPPLHAKSERGKVRWHLPFPSLFRFDRPVVTFALAFAALVLFGGLLWLLLKNPRVQQPAIVKRPTAPSPDRKSHHPVGSQSPSSTGESAITLSEPTPLAILTLQSDGPFDDKQSVHFTVPPAESDIVRLELFLESSLELNRPASYQAELLTNEGQQIAVVSELSAITANQQIKVVWNVPAGLLKAGSYRVNLRRVFVGQTQEVGHYNFQVS